MVRKVAVIMGSDSDWPVVKGACAQLKALDIPFEAHILSAHRTPAEAAAFAKSAKANGFGVILCAAGMAAHLAGAFAANTTLPVIGIPMKGGAMDGLDALLATVQMPSGIPVATVALNGAKNAAWLAAEILALGDEALAAKLEAERTAMAAQIAAAFAKSAKANGFGVILCAAGMAAHLAGAFAANTTLPVIGIPMKGGAMDGLDALLATVQMPSGIPVATVALNGAKNAAWLAAEILALGDEALAAKLEAERTAMAAQIAAKEEKLQAEIAEL